MSLGDGTATVVHRVGHAVAGVVVEGDGAAARRDHLLDQAAVVVELDLVAVAVLNP